MDLRPDHKAKKKNNTKTPEYSIFHGRHFSNCLEYVKDYSLQNNYVITYVELSPDKIPHHIYEQGNTSWQVWRKDYGKKIHYYTIESLVDKKVRILEDDDAPNGLVRLYRGVAQQEIPKSPISKAKPFVKGKPSVNTSEPKPGINPLTEETRGLNI